MKFFYLTCFLLLPYNSFASPLTGLWVTPAGNAVVELVVLKDQGKIELIDLLDPSVTDQQNPDTSLRTRPLVGITLGKSFRVKASVWDSGTIYDPDSGKTYRAKLKLLDADHLEVRGYIGTPLLGSTQTWTSFQLFSKNMKRMLENHDES